jgi:hypothetical protein
MLVTLGETPLDAGQVRMINIAAFDQPDEAFMARILDAAAMGGDAGNARYLPECDAVV